MAKPSWLEQNPVDYYNEFHFNDAVELLLSKNKKLLLSGKDIASKENPREVTTILKRKGNLFKCVENDFGFTKGNTYSPFQILTNLKYRGKFFHAVSAVGLELMDMDFPYIRVGCDYFKKVVETDRFGIDRNVLEAWKKDEIKQDLGKEIFENRLTVYDGFKIEPNNTNYKRVIGKHYNLYAPFEHSVEEFDVSKAEEELKWSLTLLRHIFGSSEKELEMGIRYLKFLYDKPHQVLPILVLVSTERETGKSTFLEWLSVLFGANMIIINPQDIASSFNFSYATKNIIGIEESRFESVQATEKLKAISTQKMLSVNAKYMNSRTLPFFGKLIITSNDENKFVKVDQEEIRYWVRKIGTPTGEKNPSIIEDLTNEIPKLLHYLNQQPKLEIKSRMGFAISEIETKALEVVKKESKEWLHKEIEICLDEFCSENKHFEEINFIAGDIQSKFFERNSKVTRAYVMRTLEDKMKMKRTDKDTRYKAHLFGDSGIPPNKSGYFFSYKNPYYKPDEFTETTNNNNYESLNNETPDGIDF